MLEFSSTLLTLTTLVDWLKSFLYCFLFFFPFFFFLTTWLLASRLLPSKEEEREEEYWAKKVKGQHEVGDVEMVNSVEVKHPVEVEQLEYSGPTK